MSIVHSESPETNRIIERSGDLLALVNREDLGRLLRELAYDWDANRLNRKAEIFFDLGTAQLCAGW